MSAMEKAREALKARFREVAGPDVTMPADEIWDGYVQAVAPIFAEEKAAHDYIWQRETVLHDPPEPEGMESTPGEFRAKCVRAILAAWKAFPSEYTSTNAVSAANACAELHSVALRQPSEEATRKAVEKIGRVAKWFGEFPATGEFWDKEKTDPMSYGACYGSNGERDYMRQVAAEALALLPPQDKP